MKRIVYLLIATIAFPFLLNAQEAAKKSKSCGCSFSSINQVGVVEGSSGSAFQAQTINGLRYRNWFAGIGVGLDHYRFRSVPLFVDLRANIFRRPNTPFIYGDVGLNIPWTEDKNKLQWGNNTFYKGLYYDAGVGYRFGLGKNRGLLLSGGFTLKQLREKRYFDVVCIRAPCPQAEGERFNFTLKRFSVKAGIQL